MILKGSQRSGSRQLAAHLLNDLDNDHVTLQQVRGFVATDLHGALAEAHAISKATQCKQFLFSLSLNPPKSTTCDLDTLMSAVDRAENVLGLENQPRAVVVHEKEGRRHAHVVWSRIDANELKAVPLSFFKNKLNGLAKELYLENGWELPDGFKENGWKNPLNFELAEWQQAKRIGLDPRETKQQFLDAWRHSDGLKALKSALEHRGYYLAQGDRRGFVAVDLHGEVYSVARMVGLKTKDVEGRLGSASDLSSVDGTRDDIRQRVTESLRNHIRNFSRDQRVPLQQLAEEREKLVQTQRIERTRLRVLQERRWTEEGLARQRQFRKGFAGLWDKIVGKVARVRQEHDREVLELYCRDVNQREALFEAQMKQRHDIQDRTDALRAQQREERIRLARHAAGLFKPQASRETERTKPAIRRVRSRGFDLEH
jgi:hypothetical protein